MNRDRDIDEGSVRVAGDRGAGRRGTTKAADEGPVELEVLRLRLPDGREELLDRRIVIGSAPDCDVIVDDGFVSGRHCVFARSGHRTTVTDCGSRNGTWIAGARVDGATVRAGTRIVVGEMTLLVVSGAAEAETELLGESAAMTRLRKELLRLGPSGATVVLLGESGTGKELAARELHRRSGRKGPFVAVNCGAISPELVESMLFGHERGAFTGAAGKHVGFFEEADGGTLFLDEIAELPLGLQPKLLRALETRTIRPVGGAADRRVDVRVVSATHRDLQGAVADKTFRLDLFHRLAQFPVQLPSLRERREDAVPLARHFLAQLAAETGETRRLSPEAEAELTRREWPGNVRELRNVLQRAWLLGGGVVIEAAEVADSSAAPAPVSAPIYSRIDQVELEMIREALRRSGGNRRAAAAALRMPKSTLCDKVRKYGLVP